MIPPPENVMDSWQGIEQSFHSGKLAHAYIIEGGNIKVAENFATRILQLLFCKHDEVPCEICSSCSSVGERKHVDVLWLEPESKSRQIVVSDVEEVIARMNRTSFEGGWKATVLLHADRLNPVAENKLLKILEEPPSRSLLLLVTDNKAALLPTIKSRCLHVYCKEGSESGVLDIENALDFFPPTTGLEVGLLCNIISAALSQLLGNRNEAMEMEFTSGVELKKEVVEARLSADRKLIQESVVIQLVRWLHDVLSVQAGIDEKNIYFHDRVGQLESIAQKYTADDILMMIRELEGLKLRLDSNLPEQYVFEEVFRKMVL